MIDPENPDGSATGKLSVPVWVKLAIGVGLLFMAYTTYLDFAKLESGEIQSPPSGTVTRSLYDIGGKWLAASWHAVAGIILLGWGVRQIKSGKE